MRACATARRCKVVGDFKKELAALADPSSSVEARQHVVKRLERDAAARQLMIDVKGACSTGAGGC